MDLDRSVGALSHLYRGGTSEAKKLFRRFLEGSFDAYTGHRNQPQTDDVSQMRKYLHFGQISPIWLALTARRARTKKDNIESFVEELIVRRELSPRRPRPELVRQRSLDLRPARPRLDRTRGLRQGPLHVSKRPEAQGQTGSVRREEDRGFGLTPGPRRILLPARLDEQRWDSGVARGDRKYGP
jgi:hypothetical protein